jgi:hypothetical protein
MEMLEKIRCMQAWHNDFNVCARGPFELLLWRMIETALCAQRNLR